LKNKIMLTLLILVLGLSLIVPGCGPQVEKHVIFATGAWSGDWLTVYPIKILLEEEFDYTTEIADTSVPAAWTAVGSGSADLWTNSWQPNQEDLKEKYADTTESLGIIYGGGPQDPCLQAWFIPTWVSEQYGITSVTDLENPEFAELFDLDGDGVGDVLGCDAAWKCAEINDQMIIDYGLEGMYEQQYGAEAMMMAAIEGQMKKQEPVLFYMYTPHPFFVRYPIGESVVVLDDPLGSWGELATVIKVANAEWVGSNPQAAELVRQVKMTQADIGWSMAEIEERGDDAETLEAIAREWMAQHQSDIDAWVAAAKAK
jgi:glycine betaine/proline transport system substrate-binding protein